MQAGPQLVVPMLNARFAANAANARWGSLYDALYGTDVIAEDDGREKGTSYNPTRGAEVIARRARRSSTSTSRWPPARTPTPRRTPSCDGCCRRAPALADPGQLVGWRGEPDAPEGVLLVHHGLHVEIQVDRVRRRSAATTPPASRTCSLEAAVSTIMDLEDSVAAVDAEDKVAGYRNWLLLNQGTLTASVAKGGETFERRARARTGCTTARTARSCCPAARCCSCARSAT